MPNTNGALVSLTGCVPNRLFRCVVLFGGILPSFDEFNIPALISVIANHHVIVYYYT
jgi:hypothetical protein